MIAHLRGALAEKHPNQVLIEAGGVGYDVTIPVSTFTHLPEAGVEVRLHIHTHVRADTLSITWRAGWNLRKSPPHLVYRWRKVPSRGEIAVPLVLLPAASGPRKTPSALASLTAYACAARRCTTLERYATTCPPRSGPCRARFR